MGLFSVFSFKKEAQKVFTKENFNKVLQTARDAIVEFAKKNMPGQEKKKHVDAIVIARILEITAGVKNSLVLWLVDRIIDVIPSVTQFIYEFLKERVENL